MTPRKSPKPPFQNAGICVCRLCGDPVTDRGPGARWHLRCLEEYRPVSNPGEIRRIAHEVSSGRCGQCGAHHEFAAATWEADHRQALWRANGDIGHWLRGNLQVLCVQPCHAEKTAADAAEYRASLVDAETP